MGYSWEALRHFGETLGLHFGTLGLHLGTLGVHVGVLWALWGVALDPSGHFCGKCLKKGTQDGRQNGNIFNDILSFRRKWETAFGLRLCSRIRVPAPCFQPLSLHWGPLFFQRFFDVFWGPKKTPKSAVGGRGGTPLFEYKNKALATCTSILCFRSATEPSTCSLPLWHLGLPF